MQLLQCLSVRGYLNIGRRPEVAHDKCKPPSTPFRAQQHIVPSILPSTYTLPPCRIHTTSYPAMPSRRSIITRRRESRRKANKEEKPQLVPVDATVLASNRLCQHCEKCVRYCGTSQPHWLHSWGFSDGLARLANEEGVPTVTHSSYRSFATAVREGCFVCNTLLQTMPGRMVSAIKRATWDLSRDNLTTFSRYYLECGKYHETWLRCHLKFSISSPSRNEANRLKVEKAFILQGGRSRCGAPLRHLLPPPL
jgi:ferredoxin